MKAYLLVTSLFFSTSSVFAATTVKVDGGDAVRLIQIIKGFSNPIYDGMTTMVLAQTRSEQLKIVCSSIRSGVSETDASCSVTLGDDYASDHEIQITEAKKFKNLVAVSILPPGKLQAHLAKKLGIVSYESVGTTVLVPRESDGRSGPYPTLKISCDSNQSTCQVLMNYNL